MDSGRRVFSAVVNIEGVKNPIVVAHLLQQEKFPALAGVQATLYARQNGFSPYNPVTDLQLERYRQGVAGSRGTVGACAIDTGGLMAMATSTGGVGLEIPGRLSDDASPCGGYCSDSLAVSATGIGETIVNTICVPRLCALADYGISFDKACAYTEKLFQQQNGDGGWIAVSRNYDIYAFYNTKGMRHYGENHLGQIIEPGR
jgi:L-asparaginase